MRRGQQEKPRSVRAKAFDLSRTDRCSAPRPGYPLTAAVTDAEVYHVSPENVTVKVVFAVTV
jgi:hypothetical protein